MQYPTLLVILSLFVLNLPFVQERIISSLTAKAFSEYDLQLSINHSKVSLLDGLVLEDIVFRQNQDEVFCSLKRVNASLTNLYGLYNGNYSFRNIELDSLNLRVVILENDSISNLERIYLKNKELNEYQSSDYAIDLKDFIITNGTFQVFNYNNTDPLVLDLNEVNMAVSDFESIHNVTSLSLDRLEFEAKDLPYSFRGHLILSPNIYEFRDFKMQCVQSVAYGSLSVKDDEGLHFNMDVSRSRIYMEDFVSMKHLQEPIQPLRVSFKSWGTRNQLFWENLKLDYENSYVIINGKVLQLSDLDKTTFDATIYDGNIELSKLLKTAIKYDLSWIDVPEAFKLLGSISGTADSLEIKLENREYGLDLDAHVHNLSAYDTVVDYATEIHFKPTVETQLEHPFKANLTLEGNFIKESGAFNMVFLGKLINFPIHENKLDAISFGGDATQEQSKVTIKLVDNEDYAELQSMFLYGGKDIIFKSNLIIEALNLEKTLALSTLGNMSLKETRAEIQGQYNTKEDFGINVELSSPTITRDGRIDKLENISVGIEYKHASKNIQVYSKDLIDASLSGDFDLYETLDFFERIEQDFMPDFTVYHKNTKKITLDLEVRDRLFDFLYPDLVLNDKTSMALEVLPDRKISKIYVSSAGFEYNGIKSDSILFSYNKDTIHNVQLKVDSLSTPFYSISKLKTKHFVSNDTMYYNTVFGGGVQDLRDKYDLNYYYYKDDKSNGVFGFNTSDIYLGQELWQINAKNNHRNKLVVQENGFFIDTLDIKNNDQKLYLFGKTQGQDNTYTLQLIDIILSKFMFDKTENQFLGLLNLEAEYNDNNKDKFSKVNMKIDDFGLEDTLFGDLGLTYAINGDFDNTFINVKLQKDETLKLNAVGRVSVSEDKERMINVFTILDDFDLDVVNYVVNRGISEVSGRVDGNIEIKGHLNKPYLKGKLSLFESGFFLDPLKLDVGFKDGTLVDFEDTAFIFDKVEFFEKKHQTKGQLSGVLNVGLDNFGLDLNIKSLGDRLFVIDWQKEDDSPFYGLGFIEGTVDLEMSNGQTNIDVDAVTSLGTDITIPINTDFNIDDSFVTINSKDKYKNTSEKKSSDYLFSMNLNVTPEANIRVENNIESTASIDANLSGELLINSDFKNQLNIVGELTTHAGGIDISYLSLLNKKIDLLPGGKIKWEGSYHDMVFQNFKMVYSLFTNPDVLLDNNTFNRELKTEVIFSVDGSTTFPNITYDIKFPRLSATQNAELLFYMNDQESLQEQSLSLLTQGKFINQKTTELSFEGNLTETLSTFFNKHINDNEGFVNVGLTYQGNQLFSQSKDQANDLMGVSFSSKIRENILFNGKIGVPVNAKNYSGIDREGEIEFLLNKDKTLRFKIFNRRSRLQQFSNNQDNYDQGIGISYNVGFDSFKSLFKKRLQSEEETAP